MDDEHKRRCLVRQVIRWRIEHGSEWAKDWLDKWTRKHRDNLADEVREQWRRGNRGSKGEWR